MFTCFEKEELNFKTPAGRNKISNICNPAWNTVIHVTGKVSGLGEADETRSVVRLDPCAINATRCFWELCFHCSSKLHNPPLKESVESLM